MMPLILFPSDYFHRSKVDPEFEKEVQAAAAAGFEILIFAYEDWFDNATLHLNRKPEGSCCAIYRGWMMTVEQYEQFYHALNRTGIRLLTSVREYQQCHWFPNSYPDLKEDTARILLYPSGTSVDVEEIKRTFSKFMIKDYVKSVKGSSFPTYFDATITQSEFNFWMQKFYQYRGSLLSGGICVKEYLDLKRVDGQTHEIRVFYLNHEVMQISGASRYESGSSLPPRALLEKYTKLKSPFYTVDYAELDDGSWKVIECGDGQVSGILSEDDIPEFYQKLYQSCIENQFADSDCQ